MTEQEKVKEMLEVGLEHETSHEQWIECLLSSIAFSLAVIADEMKKDSEIKHKLERRLYEE